MAKKQNSKKSKPARKATASAKKNASKKKSHNNKKMTQNPTKPIKPAPSPKNTLSNEQRIKHALKKLTGGVKNTPAIFKLPAKRNTPVAFSLDEIRNLITEKSKKGVTESPLVEASAARKAAQVAALEVEQKPRVLKSATIDDLLGGPKKKVTPVQFDEKKVPQKFMPYFRKLIAMREHLILSVGERSEQTKSNIKEAAGDLSSYGQHIADAGTDASDYDFALGLVSSEQEMLREVEAALGRIFDGTYGMCEVTGKIISRDRLNAVPFTRFSKEGQDQYEKTRRRTTQRIGISSGDEDDEVAMSDDAGEGDV